MLKGTLILLIVALAVSIGTPTTGQQVESVLTLPLVESPPVFGTFYLGQNHVPYPFDPSFGRDQFAPSSSSAFVGESPTTARRRFD